MKSTVAKKIILPVILAFVLLTSVLTLFNRQYVDQVVLNENKDSLYSIAKNMDALWKASISPMSGCTEEEFLDAFTDIGNDFISSFNLKYISLYIPDLSTDEVLYVDLLTNPNGNYPDLPEEQILRPGRRISYVLTKEERAVWNGEEKIGYILYDNIYGHNLCIAIREQSPSGQYMMLTMEWSYDAIYSVVRQVCVMQGIVILITFILISLLLYRVVEKNVSVPARAVSDAMDTFIMDGSRNRLKLDAQRNDEFGVINRAFNQMADNIDQYLQSIGILNEAQEQRKAEEVIASRVQRGLLPPESAEYPGCQIHATISPAKNVAGDLYDYLSIDEENTLITIADVSGDGLIASFLMTVTLTMLHQYAKMNLEPAEILERTNQSLAEKNPSMQFVTAFVGIYNNETRTFTYSNAGHNLPYLLGKTVRPLDEAAGTVLGLFEDEQYTQSVIQLHPGESLFLYTDGVNEAVDAEKRFFGTDRLEQTLLSYHPSKAVSLIEYVEQAMRRFVGDAPQNDDVTMLSLTVQEKADLFLTAQNRDFLKIKAAILESAVPQELKLPLCLAAEEIFVNICSYAYPEPQTENPVRFTLTCSDHIAMRFEDSGQPYDPREQVITADEYDPDAQEGGLGKLIAFSITDDIRYEYVNGKNILTMIKYEEDSVQ